MQPVKTKKKLSRADKKQIEAAIARANRTDKKGKSAQDSIPYERMWPDGICRVSDSHYTKTIQFQDINYQLSQNEDKTAIFEGWCDFLNYFDSSIHFQLSFLNLAASEETFANSISIPPQGDAFDSIREEYTTMLQNQLARGNNGLIKTKYLTFGIDADSIKAAKPRLERIETDILNNFKRLGVAARTLDGKERLAQLHAVFHMDEQLPFQFEWDWLAPSGLSTKDFIAPSSFEFRTGKQFRMGKKYGAVSFLQILAPELNDRLLADFLDMESSLIVSMHIQSVDQVKAIKTVKRKITDLDRSKIEEQKKAVRAGYDMDIIPSDLATYGSEAKKLLQDLQSRNYFYILIDRANEDKKTAVHFLNQVDEADLMALMEDGTAKEEPPAVCSCSTKCETGTVNTACPVCATDMSKCTGKAPEPPAETPEPEKETPAGLNPAALILLLALLGGGGVFAYLKLVKNKPKTKGNDSLDDYDYGEEDSEEWETEDEEVLEDGFEGSDPNEERDRAD